MRTRLEQDAPDGLGVRVAASPQARLDDPLVAVLAGGVQNCVAIRVLAVHGCAGVQHALHILVSAMSCLAENLINRIRLMFKQTTVQLILPLQIPWA